MESVLKYSNVTISYMNDKYNFSSLSKTVCLTKNFTRVEVQILLISTNVDCNTFL